ncbi:MAG TPA: MotA/TolQ/ExbB proton channel family protein [bacterium]|nr:MotA/TolQ/ExbB proton channel family protein [bacterium]
MPVDFNWMAQVGSSPVLMVLLGFSVVTLGVAIERLLYYSKRSGRSDATRKRMLDEVRNGDVKAAMRTCDATSHPMGYVVKTLFRDGAYLIQGAEERLQIALSEQKMILERNLGILGTMAAVAPLVGLLGTVWGIMRAFHDMAASGSAAPSVVAAGVAEALVTTAAGLVVAVPAVMLYNYFARRLNVMLVEAENHARAVRSELDGPVEVARPERPRPAAMAPERAPAPAVER